MKPFDIRNQMKKQLLTVGSYPYGQETEKVLQSVLERRIYCAGWYCCVSIKI